MSYNLAFGAGEGVFSIPPHSQCEGRGFDPLPLHHLSPFLASRIKPVRAIRGLERARPRCGRTYRLESDPPIEPAPLLAYYANRGIYGICDYANAKCGAYRPSSGARRTAGCRGSLSERE